MQSSYEKHNLLEITIILKSLFEIAFETAISHEIAK